MTLQRLLDKQEEIETICNNLKAQQEEEGGDENKEELQIQLQEINEMLSPVERDTAKRIHERMDQLRSDHTCNFDLSKLLLDVKNQMGIKLLPHSPG